MEDFKINILKVWMFKLLIIFVTTLVLIPQLFSQFAIKGIIKDAETSEVLPYATIKADNQLSTTSGLDGSFTINSDEAIDKIIISYIGYEEKILKTQKSGKVLDLGVILLLEEIEELNTVTITSGKFKKRIQDLTVTLEILKPGFLERNHSANFSDILDKIPGVNFIDGQVNIRGGSGYSYGAGSRVMLLIDNIPALQFDAAFPNWGDIPIENIAQVEVLKGAGSALYGSAAMNGVINILTKYAKKEPLFNVQTQLTAYLSPRDSLKKWWDTTPYTYNISGVFAKKFGKLDLVSSMFYYNEHSFQKDKYNRYGRFHLKLDYHLKNNLSVGVNSNINSGNSQNFFYWKNEKSGAYQADSSNYSRNKKTRYTIDPHLTYYGKKNLTHRIISRIYGIDNASDNNQSNSSISLYGEYQIQKKWENRNVVLTSGLVSNYAKVRAELYSDTVFQSSNFAYYLQLEKKLFKRLSINSGARYEINRISGPSIVEGEPVPDEGFESRPVFRFGLNYKLFRYSNLRASWGQGYRYPSIAEKYISTTAGALNIVPNTRLKSETGWTAELGFRQGLKFGSFFGYTDISIFQSAYQDMMEFNIKLGSFPPKFTAQNIGNIIIKGAEISCGLQGKIAAIGVEFQGSYTYLDPKYIDFNDTIKILSSSDENILKYRNKHSLKFDSNLKYKSLSWGLGMNYFSYMEAIDAVFNEFIPGVKSFRELHSTGTNIWYSNLAYSINESWLISIRIDNIFNTEYALRPALLEAPRNLSVRLKYTL